MAEAVFQNLLARRRSYLSQLPIDHRQPGSTHTLHVAADNSFDSLGNDRRIGAAGIDTVKVGTSRPLIAGYDSIASEISAGIPSRAAAS